MTPPRTPATGGLALSSGVLAATTVVAALSMGRLFAGTSWVLPVVVAAAGAHALAWGLRRLAVGGVVAYLASSIYVVLAVAWLALPDATAYGFPGPGFLGTARTELARAVADFRVVVAPTQPTPGFLAAAVLGAAVAGLLSDWAAFRVRATFEALLPSFTLFLFAAVLGDERLRDLSVAAYLVAATGFLIVHQAGLDGGATAWFTSRVRHTGPAVARVFALLAVVMVLAAVVAAPLLPGVGADPVIAYRNQGGDGPGDRVTISPLVDIRGRLVDNTNAELFSVKADRRSYWRLTSLDEFDGRIWSSNGSYRPVKRRLPGGVPDEVPVAAVRQEFEILALSSIWLPAAYEPARIDGVDGVSYERDSGSLISDNETSDGLAYVVQSEQPLPTATGLQSARNSRLPVDVRDRYLALPDVDPAIAAETNRILAGKVTPYEKAKALQDHFRSGQFTYNLDARPGHDERALRRFLLVTKEGYCEQFSGAYAVMARIAGLPARVAVGFTPGTLDPATGRYVVRGVNAHAWPEVYLEGFGWVAFEPTPGRGAPGAEQYTGVPEAQVAPANPNASVTQPPTTAAAQEPGTNTTLPRDETLAPGDAVTTGSGPNRAEQLARLLMAALALVAVLAVGTVAAKVSARHRRRSRASTPADRVLLAWSEAGRVLAQAGAAKRPSETALEFVDRLRRVRPAVADPVATLARSMVTAAYAPFDPSEQDAAEAEASADVVRRALTAALSPRKRLIWELDPRPLWANHELRQTLTTTRRTAA